MSKSNSKKEIFSLRQEFHQALEKWDFIQEISLSQDACIEIQETNKSDLKKVVINHLQLSSKTAQVMAFCQRGSPVIKLTWRCLKGASCFSK